MDDADILWHITIVTSKLKKNKKTLKIQYFASSSKFSFYNNYGQPDMRLLSRMKWNLSRAIY